MRQKATSWAAALLFVVGAGAVTLENDDGAGTRLEAAIAPTTTTTTAALVVEPGDPPTTIEEAPAPAPTTTAKTRRVAPVTTTTAAPVPTGPAPLTMRPWPYPTRNNPRLEVPPDPNRTEWSFSAKGISFTLKVDQQNAPAGTPLSFTYEASAGDSVCCGAQMLWGGGQDWQHGLLPCLPMVPGPSTVTAPITYNREGIWEFQATVFAGPCDKPQDYISIYGWVYVTSGEATVQGPTKPQMELSWKDGDGPPVAVNAKAWDEDGYLDHFTIDWGDGSPVQTAPGDGMGCIQLTSGWPNTSHAFLVGLPHEYPDAGDYTVTVTAYSRGCTGNLVQTVVGTLTS